MKILVAIITYNRKPFLARTLNSVKRAIVSGPQRHEALKFEIAVVDDASAAAEEPDGTVEFLQGLEEAGHVDYVEISDIRGGVARNSNRAIKLAGEVGADILFLLNDDIEVLPGVFDLYLYAMQETGFSHFCFTDLRSEHKVVNQYQKDGVWVVERRRGDGVFMTITKKMTEVMGGFDSAYGLYGQEHADYSRRAAAAGFAPTRTLDGLTEYMVVDIGEAKDFIKVLQYDFKVLRALPNPYSHMAEAVKVWTKQKSRLPQVFKEIEI